MSNLETLDLEPQESESIFCLRGAENFSRFLRQITSGKLKAGSPYEAPALQLGGPLSDRYEIFLDGRKIGDYFIQRCENGGDSNSVVRFYRGRIPGLINHTVAEGNAKIMELIKNDIRSEFLADDLGTVDSFVLDYSCMRWVSDNGNDASGFQRYDMHEHIPFP